MPRRHLLRLAVDPLVLATALLCGGGLAATGWLLFRPDTPAAAAARPTAVTHLKCPACGDEIPYDSALDGRVCTACTVGVSYAPAAAPGAADDGRVGVWGRVGVLLVVGSVLVPGFAHLAVLRARSLRRAAERAVNPRLVCRCPFCDRKIGFPTSKVGTVCVCPGCKTAFQLPALAD